MPPVKAYRELALVMPVYNGAAGIAGAVGAWLRELDALGLDFELIVLNDGSTDGTGERLAALRRDPRVTVVEKANEGHGPTILAGYALAVQRAEWVFQADSDNEVPPASFGALWARRAGYDALLGERAGRDWTAGRRLVSGLARFTIKLLFGGVVSDVNTPFRLLRSAALRPLLAAIPAGTFAPNILITGLLARKRARVLGVPVPYKAGKSVSGALGGWRLWVTAARAFAQTARFRLGCREGGKP